MKLAVPKRNFIQNNLRLISFEVEIMNAAKTHKADARQRKEKIRLTFLNK
jgi:hypothetical protein